MSKKKRRKVRNKDTEKPMEEDKAYSTMELEKDFQLIAPTSRRATYTKLTFSRETR